MVVSAYRELLESGEITAQFIALVVRVTKAVVRVRNFPPLEGHEKWDVDAVNDVVQGFWAARPVGERVAVLLAAAPDEARFVAALETAITRHIQSELRKTARGSVARTVLDVVKVDARLEFRDDHVRLVAWPTDWQPSTAAESSLLASAYRVEVTRPAWNPGSSHRPPLADRASLSRLCVSVLEAAGGPVQLGALLDVIIARCAASETALVQSFDEFRDADQPSVHQQDYAASRAVEIWNELSALERQTLAVLGDSVREAGRQLGLGKSRAAEVLGQVRAVLADHLRNDPDQVAIVRRLRELAAGADD